jgi:hypothetical protein
MPGALIGMLPPGKASDVSSKGCCPSLIDDNTENLQLWGETTTSSGIIAQVLIVGVDSHSIHNHVSRYGVSLQ